MDLAPILLLTVIVLVGLGLYFYRSRKRNSSEDSLSERLGSYGPQQEQPFRQGRDQPPDAPSAPYQPDRGESEKTEKEAASSPPPLQAPAPAAPPAPAPAPAPVTSVPPQSRPSPVSDESAAPAAPPPPASAPAPVTSTGPQSHPGTIGSESSTMTFTGGGAEMEAVHVSAFYPKEVKPADWQPVHAYLFRQYAASAMMEDAGKQLGTQRSRFRAVDRTAQVPVSEGALVVATPDLPGFEFNPPSAQIRFLKEWHRFDFETRAKDAPLNQAANGWITFTVEGIIVADVPLSVYVGESAAEAAQPTMSTAKIYQAIFCSYSHQDSGIVTRAERAYKALGIDYLRDVMSLKSGQEWSDELLNLISRADVFQLFWSQASAQSQHVRFEWEHALKLAAQREHFIRPVYWQTPQPPIPPELHHIHFTYQPDLAD